MKVCACCAPGAAPPSTADEAVALGLKHFHSGIPCPRGHIGPKFASDGSCVICRSSEENRAASRERSRKWHAANREQANASRRVWQSENKDRAAQTVAAWYARNKERKQVIRKRRRAAKAGAAEHHTAAALENLWQSVPHRCAACGTKLTRRSRHIDHIRPLSRGGSNAIRNIQFLCAFCNRSKGARDPLRFMQAKGFLV